MKIVFIVYWISLYLINNEIQHDKVKNTLEIELINKINSFTYIGINNKLKDLGLEYTLVNYGKHALLLVICLGFICYMTIKRLDVTLLITTVYTICLPYLIYFQKLQKYKEKLLSNIFIYSESLLMYLREDKTVVDILRDVEDSVDNPLKNDLIEVNNYINKTTNIVNGLKIMEDKYNYSIVINAHIILKHKVIEGIVNNDLIDYLYTNIENYELSFQECLAKRKSNNFLFYLIIVLNAFGVLSLTNFINVQSNQQSMTMILVLILFYILNLCTILFYEKWCFKSLSIE
ncbi:MAG: hypothetical protein RR571_01290 [Anaerorhabdus sp.]